MTVGLERTHPQLLGQGEGLVVVIFGRLDLQGLAPRRHVAEEAQGIRLIPTFLVRTGERQRPLGEGLRLFGDIAARRDPPEVEPAVAHYQQALALAEELGMRPLVAHSHRGLGTLYVQIGQAEQARAELATASAMYQAMDMTFWLPETEAALVQVEGQR